MYTEEQLSKMSAETIEERKKFLDEIIAASARYERMMANKDFNDILLDLTNVADIASREIQGYLSAYTMSTSFFKRMRIMEVIAQYQMRKDLITEAINYPKQIVQKAVEAREELDMIKKQEKETTNG